MNLTKSGRSHLKSGSAPPTIDPARAVGTTVASPDAARTLEPTSERAPGPVEPNPSPPRGDACLRGEICNLPAAQLHGLEDLSVLPLQGTEKDRDASTHGVL